MSPERRRCSGRWTPWSKRARTASSPAAPWPFRRSSPRHRSQPGGAPLRAMRRSAAAAAARLPLRHRSLSDLALSSLESKLIMPDLDPATRRDPSGRQTRTLRGSDAISDRGHRRRAERLADRGGVSTRVGDPTATPLESSVTVIAMDAADEEAEKRMARRRRTSGSSSSRRRRRPS